MSNVRPDPLTSLTFFNDVFLGDIPILDVVLIAGQFVDVAVALLLQA
jgi:hypothetical protein